MIEDCCGGKILNPEN